MRSAPSPSSGSRALRAAEHDRREEQADLVDLAGVEERAGQVRAALEQDRGDARRAELVERVAHARRARSRRWRRSPRRRRPRARRRRVRGAARATTTVSGTSAAPRTSWESSGRRASESKTIAARLAARRPRSRAVSSGSSASAVPMPTATASHSARQWCDSRARVLAGDPLRVAGAGRDLAVERHRRLEEHARAARCARACGTAG